MAPATIPCRARIEHSVRGKCPGPCRAQWVTCRAVGNGSRQAVPPIRASLSKKRAGSRRHIKEEQITKKQYIVVDFEATCWTDESRRGDGEIIEIGAVMMDSRTAKISGEFQSFVRPVRYPRLSEFCTRLTNITQADVDTAPTFTEALAAFLEWVRLPESSTLCSWGALDRFLLRQACRFHRVAYPFDDEYINIKPAFSEAFTGRGVSMERALEIAGLEPFGRLHRAPDDARNAARLFQQVLNHSFATRR